MFDASTFYGCWPFRPAAFRTLNELSNNLKKLGISGAAVSPAEAIFHPEPMAANRRLLQAMEKSHHSQEDFRLVALPAIDPSLPLWREHVQECLDLQGSAIGGFKIFPTYHNYDLDLAELHAMAETLAEKGLVLAIQVRMEDERSHHPLMQAQSLSPKSIATFALQHSELKILVCGAYMLDLNHYKDANNLNVELSFIESGETLPDALGRIGADGILLGTHAPLFYPAVAVAKIAESNLSPAVKGKVFAGNFQRLFS